jgi:membrane protein DedA with SNARE-associated domain
MRLEELIANYGYIAILIGTFFEGETILIIAGFLAHGGYLKLPYVIAAAFTGTLIGDQLYFHIGRIKGRQFIANRTAWKSKTDRVFRLLGKHQSVFILGFRFLAGIRTVSAFILGSAGIPSIRYLVLNGCGALVWAVVIGLSGYFFGHALEAFLGDIKQYEKWVIIGMACVGAALWISKKWGDKKLNRNFVRKAQGRGADPGVRDGREGTSGDGPPRGALPDASEASDRNLGKVPVVK